MPLYQEWSPNAHSLAAIWRIDEDEAFFKERTGVQPDVKHPRRRLERHAGRYLLQYLKVDFPLHHISPDIHDKPRIPGNRYFFSISHSYPYVAAVLSDREECGIDIQTWHPRIEKIAHMFLGPEELRCLPSPEQLTLAWSAKESAYKWHGRRGADFIRDLPIQKVDQEKPAYFAGYGLEPFTVGMSCFGTDIQVSGLIHNDFALAFLVQHRPDPFK